jgi:hypothetical protein
LDLKFFFKGMQNKETSASAWLATLLHHNEAFRKGFLDLVLDDGAPDRGLSWAVNVETPLVSGPCDVTLDNGRDTFILLEDKVSASAMKEEQLLGYYQGALGDPERRTKRVVAAYLGPNSATGEGETALVRESKEWLERQAQGTRDRTACLGWKDNITGLVERTTDVDDWFARTGLAAILAHIQKLERGRPPNPEREILRNLLADVARRVMDEGGPAGWGPNVRFDRWASRGQEAQYTPNVDVTTFLAFLYDEDPDPPYALRDVVHGDIVRGRLSVSFSPSVKHGRLNQELMALWKDLAATGSITLPVIGEIKQVNKMSYAAGVDFYGTRAELADWLVGWGVSVLTFLREYR